MGTLAQWLHQTAGGLPRQFWYLWANALISRAGSFVIFLLALYLTQQRGFSPTYAGFVIGLAGAGGAVGTLVGGVLADRLGRKPTMLAAMYTNAALMLVLGSVRGKTEIALVVLLLGMTNEATRPASSALMVDIVGESDRLRAFSLNYWVINLGFSFSATMAGLLAAVNYTLIFVLDALSTAAAATLVAVAVREPARVRSSRAAPSGPKARGGPGLMAVFTDKVFMTFVGANVLLALVFMQHTSTLPMAMAHDGLSTATFGTVISLNGVLIVLGQLFMPRLLEHLSRAQALALAAVLTGVGFGLNAWANTAWLYAVAVLIWTFGEMFSAPSNSTLNAELAPADMRGRYLGVFSLSWSAANFLAPTLGAFVLQHAGDTALWLGCLAVGLLVAAIQILSGPSRERRAAELREAQAAGADLAPSRRVPSPSAAAPDRD